MNGENAVIKQQPALVVWITGLSGAGKSTLARVAITRLRGRGLTVVLLDGDELREIFGAAGCAPGDHARERRRELALRYSRLCGLIAEQGVTVVIATISMFREVHQWNRANLPRYFEAYLRVPVEELRHRDPKGIYRRFDSGELFDIAGIDLAVDEPAQPDWVAEYVPGRTQEQLADELMKQIDEAGF